jgi:hypothetical protein
VGDVVVARAPRWAKLAPGTPSSVGCCPKADAGCCCCPKTAVGCCGDGGCWPKAETAPASGDGVGDDAGDAAAASAAALSSMEPTPSDALKLCVAAPPVSNALMSMEPVDLRAIQDYSSDGRERQKIDSGRRPKKVSESSHERHAATFVAC